MNSLEKIREAVDEVVAQVMLSHADQLRNQISDRIKVVVDADAEKTRELQNQLKDTSRQLEEVKQESAERQQQIESLERQLHELETLAAQTTEQARQTEEDLKSRIATLEPQLRDTAEELKTRTRELEQLRQSEAGLKTRAAELEKQIEQVRAESQEALQSKDAELEHARIEGQEQVQAKERELLDQVHLLEELLVQGQHAREQQLEAKDQELKEQLELQKTSYEKKIAELSSHGSDLHGQLQELQQNLSQVQAQLQAQTEELGKRQSEFERVNGESRNQKALWEERERELTTQISESERRLSEYAAAEKDWQKREHELMGHRDKVLSSSAEAAQTSQRELQMALEDQQRLQTQIDLLMEELAKVRNTLELKQEEFSAREGELNSEVERLRAGGAVAAPAETSPALAGGIHSAVAVIRSAHSQTEILKALLDGAAQFAGRAGIFVSHGRTASGWAGSGFADEEGFRQISLDCGQGLLAKVIQSRQSAQGAPTDLDPKLADKVPLPSSGNVFLFPLVIRDRVAAMLYADSGTAGGEVSQPALEALVKAAAGWLDELSRPKPAAATKPAESAPPQQTKAESKRAAAAAPAPAAASGEPDNATHQKARRFAKLLVDEIKLYNKEEVDAGRKNHDLYDRLRDSIDKSRASYDKRWGTTITNADYFKEELVRNLAENDVAVLGSNFPS